MKSEPSNRRHVRPLGLVAAGVLLVALPWQRAYAQTPRVQADQTYTKTVTALGDTGTISIQFRSIRVQITMDSGKPKKYILRMLYDPKTKLFYWQAFELYQGYDPEGDANLALSNTVVYVAADRMAVFNLGVGGSALRVSESSERENSIDQAQENAIRSLEKKPLSPFKWDYNSVDYLKQIPRPRDFLKQCITDIDMPHIQTVQRRGQQWEVKIAAQNGNVAVLSLDDSYNLIATKVVLNPNADLVGGCK